MENQSFHHKEVTLDHDLRDGKKTHAAVSLLHEFESNPQEALNLVKRELQRTSAAPGKDKLHLAVQSNGDVIVWDQGEKNGYYAGNVPCELRSQVLPQKAAPVALEQLPPPPAPLPPAEVVAPPVESQQMLPPPIPSFAPRQAEHHDSGPQPYEYQQPRHRGFHIPCPIDIGVRDGSFHLGVNILGLAKGGVMLGAKNRGYVGSDALNTEVSAGVDLNKEHIGPAADWRVVGDAITSGNARVGITPRPDGINLGAGADASAFGRNVGAGGHGGVEFGDRLGPHADGYAHVGPAGAEANTYANLSDQGLQAGISSDVGAQPYAGVHAGGKFGLGKSNEAHADVGTNIGDNGVSAGAGVYPQFHPDVYGRGYSGSKEAGIGLIPARAWSRDTDTADQGDQR